MDNTFEQEKLLPRLAFNPGLALTGFRTTRPSLLYKHTINNDFPKTSDHFPKIYEVFSKLFRGLEERFRTFPKISEDIGRFPRRDR